MGRKRLKRTTKIILIVVVMFFVAAAVEVFIPTGFRPAYLEEENYPPPQDVACTLDDFSIDGAERSGNTVTTTTPDGYLSKREPLDMPVTRMTMNFTSPAAQKTRLAIYYTTAEDQEISDRQMVQYYVFAGDTAIAVDMKDVEIEDVRIDLSDETGVSLEIGGVGFHYIRPLTQCYERFSFVRLLMFWAVLALIPIELININKP